MLEKVVLPPGLAAAAVVLPFPKTVLAWENLHGVEEKVHEVEGETLHG